MPSSRIVEPFDVIKDISSCLITRPISMSTGSIIFHSREEALHDGIVVALALTAHAALDTVIRKQLLELLTSVLATLVAMMQELGVRPSATPGRGDLSAVGRHRPRSGVAGIYDFGDLFGGHAVDPDELMIVDAQSMAQVDEARIPVGGGAELHDAPAAPSEEIRQRPAVVRENGLGAETQTVVVERSQPCRAHDRGAVLRHDLFDRPAGIPARGLRVLAGFPIAGQIHRRAGRRGRRVEPKSAAEIGDVRGRPIVQGPGLRQEVRAPDLQRFAHDDVAHAERLEITLHVCFPGQERRNQQGMLDGQARNQTGQEFADPVAVSVGPKALHDRRVVDLRAWPGRRPADDVSPEGDPAGRVVLECRPVGVGDAGLPIDDVLDRRGRPLVQEPASGNPAGGLPNPAVDQPAFAHADVSEGYGRLGVFRSWHEETRESERVPCVGFEPALQHPLVIVLCRRRVDKSDKEDIPSRSSQANCA